MNYLLDTNAWLQLGQAPTQIPLRVRKILLAENAIALSPFSIIAATAPAHQLTLVTCDRKLITSPHVKTLSTR